MVLNYRKKIIHRIETVLDDPDEQGITAGERNKCDKIDADQFIRKLEKFKEDLNKSLRNVRIKQQSTSFINRMVVTIALDKDARWKEDGITVAGGHGKGNRVRQLDGPYAIAFDDDQTIYIADRDNNRIIQWKHNAREGQVIVGGTDQENQNHQLKHPVDVLVDHETKSLIISDYGNRRVVRWSPENPTNVETIISGIQCSGLAMDKNGSLYASEWKKCEVRRRRRGESGNGTIVAGGNGLGAGLNQLACPCFLFVDDEQSLYVSDYHNHRVMKWVKNANVGIVVAGGNDGGSSSKQLFGPQGIVVDSFGQIYVADSDNHRVMRWHEGASEGTIVLGGNGKGEQANQLNPMGLASDRLGNLYVTDYQNHRIQRFELQ